MLIGLYQVEISMNQAEDLAKKVVTPLYFTA